jgi:hypothetical protein
MSQMWKCSRKEDMRIKKLFLFVCVIAAGILLSACSESQSEPTPTGTPPPRSITVSGSGKVFMTPDIATISIGIHTEDESATRAVDNNNAQVLEVTQVLITMGLEEEDIQTSSFNISAQLRGGDRGVQEETYYIVDNTVFVTVRDLEQLGEIMGAVVEAGANSIFGIQFDVDDKTEALSRARRAAVKDAQSKAEELAQAAGVTLGEVQVINEFGGDPVPVFEGEGNGAIDASSEQEPVSIGQLSLTVDVSVVYDIQ